MLSFEEARGTILKNVSPLGVERVQILDAVGRVLAEDVYSPWDMPQWDNSAMDGYAVRAADCRPGATLEVRGYIPAGGLPDAEVTPGTAIRIMTGAPVPDGADAVVPVEETDDGELKVRIDGKVALRDHIRYKGEDIAAGEKIIPAGTLLRPAEIGMLASFSKVFIPVYRRPKVAILSTGDELVEPGEPLGPGRIINSNTLAVAAALKEIGAEPVILGIASDDRESHLSKMTEGLKADAMITSAGVSAGDRDLVREILDELDVKPVFWKIDIKPGRPTAFALKGEKPVFSLPGNPVSTMITFEELVKPALLKMMGHSRVIKPSIKMKLKEDAKKKSGRVHFMRVQVEVVDGEYIASTSGDQNTGILKTMVRANGLALLPADRDYFAAGDTVDVHLLSEYVTMIEEE